MRSLKLYGPPTAYFSIAVILFFCLLITKSLFPESYENTIIILGLLAFSYTLLRLGNKIIGVQFKEVSSLDYSLLIYFLP